MDSAHIISFPQPPRQLGTAQITALANGKPSHCQLVHNQQNLNVISTLDIPHQWQHDETVTILYSQDKAVITGCDASPDNRFNLHVTLKNNITNLHFGEENSGKKASHCTFLCTGTNITIATNATKSELLFEMGSLDNNGLWCLHVLGFKIHVQ